MAQKTEEGQCGKKGNEERWAGLGERIWVGRLGRNEMGRLVVQDEKKKGKKEEKINKKNTFYQKIEEKPTPSAPQRV